MGKVIDLLIADGEFALGFLVGLGILIKTLDGVVVEDLLSKLDVAFGILVSGIDFSVVGQGRESLVEGLLHLFRGALKETTTAANEQSVASEDGSVLPVLEIVADTVLSVTWGV